MSLILPPLSLYIHIPWCVRKCPYCDFNSHVANGDIPEDDYSTALLVNLDACLPEVRGRRLHSIFFGGGTPSLFSASSIARILSAADSSIGFEDDIEITLEANPGTFEQDRFAMYRQAGVNRLSIGVQSFSSSQLETLGRIHSETDASLAVRRARDVGFDNINIDLMHGLPQQTVALAMNDLHRAIELDPTHLSWYQLTIEKNTAFYSNPPQLPTSDYLAEIEERGFELLTKAGFKRYEVSAFCRDNEPSKHNMNYWRFGDYLGIGAGAHSKITRPKSNQVCRSQMTRLPEHYHNRHREIEWTPVDQTELPFEFMMNALRLTKGISVEYFVQRTGITLAAIKPTIESLVGKGLLVDSKKCLCTTATGMRFLNDVVEAFIAVINGEADSL